MDAAAESVVGKQPDRGASLPFWALWAPYALLVGRFWFLTDDAYISFRYARNFARGDGLRYNLGDPLPVEGYSNFLWTLVCSAIERLGGDIEIWPPILSLFCGTLLLWLFRRSLIQDLLLQPRLAWIATACLAWFTPFAVWSTGGLETMPFALALFVTFRRAVLRRAGFDGIGAGLAALALALLRVEGLPWAVVVGLLGALAHRMHGERALKPIATYFAILLIGYGAYFAWRYGYYGLPFPNTAYAKVGFSMDVLARGARYLGVYVLTFVVPLFAVAGAACALARRWDVRLGARLAVVAMALGTLLYPVLVGGDFMAMGRFFVGGLPFHAMLFAWLLGSLGRPESLAVRSTALAHVVLGVLPAFNVHAVPREIRARYHFRHNVNLYKSEWEQWRYMDENARRWKAKGLALKEYARPGDTLVLGAIGNVGYFSELYIYDKAGLVNHEVAVSGGEPDRPKSPGHDKGVHARFFLDRHPTYMDAKLVAGTGMFEDAKREAEAWRRDATLSHLYAADFVFLPEDGQWPSRILLVLRELPPGADAQQQWEQFFASLQAVAQKEDTRI